MSRAVGIDNNSIIPETKSFVKGFWQKKRCIRESLWTIGKKENKIMYIWQKSQNKEKKTKKSIDFLQFVWYYNIKERKYLQTSQMKVLLDIPPNLLT